MTDHEITPAAARWLAVQRALDDVALLSPHNHESTAACPQCRASDALLVAARLRLLGERP